MSNHEKLKIRGTHRYAFRSGEWGTYIGSVYMYVTYPDVYRWCHAVRFADGTVDYMPIDPAISYNIEFRTVNE